MSTKFRQALFSWGQTLCTNNPKTIYETPNIDQLAAQGMRFTDGYAASSVCSPTRASIMTGKYPPRVGITDWIKTDFNNGTSVAHLPLEEVTIAEVLRNQGYSTYFSGKWHLGDGKYSPNAYGFGSGLQGKVCEYYPPNNDPNHPVEKYDPKKTDRIASDFIHFPNTDKSQKPFFAYPPRPGRHPASAQTALRRHEPGAVAYPTPLVVVFIGVKEAIHFLVAALASIFSMASMAWAFGSAQMNGRNSSARPW